MAERNEADALFATKRKKQQEEQAEQERREEMSRKKAEMEAEIRRLEEEARRQKEQQEEARRQAEEEARRVKKEAEEAEARAERAREMAEEARRKQEEVRREEERRFQEKREEEKKTRERAAQEKARAKQEEAERAEERKREAAEKRAAKEAAKAEARSAVKEKPVRPGREKADIQPGKKLPVLPLAIGGVVVAAVLVICLVLFSGGKKGGVFGTDCDLMAAKQVLGYDVFYPESFEEAYSDGGVYLKYGSVDKGDFSFVYVLGGTQDDMNYMTESTDPTDLIHVMEEYTLGVNDSQIYKMDTSSGRAVYCSEYIPFDISSITDQEEGVMASTSIMMLPLEGEYLIAVYATMKPSYEEPWKK